MAVDKLVDSTQLNADLTSVANAIRAKSGGSSQLAFPAGFVSEIGNIPSGGGGSGIPLIDTITVPADTRAVDLDFSNYNNLNFFLVLADVKLTAADWLYYVRNGSSPSGGTYDRTSVTHRGMVFLRSNPTIATSSDDLTIIPQQSIVSALTGLVTNLYIYTYTATKYIKAGSTFKIYGGNYADL